MQRLFLTQSFLSKKIIISDKAQVHHIRNVLHMREKEELVIVDKQDREYAAEIKELNPQAIVLEIKREMSPKQKNKIKVVLACAIPKRSKMDDIIDKLAQLGVHRIIPLKTKHVVVRLDKSQEALRRQRWERIAQSASQQCQRNDLMVVDPIRDFKELLLESKNFELKLIPTLKGEREEFKNALKDKAHKSILVAIGPEGDFSDEEIGLACEAGFVPVSLGDLVLRVETAAVAVASFIRLAC